MRGCEGEIKVQQIPILADGVAVLSCTWFNFPQKKANSISCLPDLKPRNTVSGLFDEPFSQLFLTMNQTFSLVFNSDLPLIHIIH
jgi:hypothetical protein